MLFLSGLHIHPFGHIEETSTYLRIIIRPNPNIEKIYCRYRKKNVYLYDGENPNLGLDEHGNILLNDNYSFPVLMGGWSYLNSEEQLVAVTDPLIITFK